MKIVADLSALRKFLEEAEAVEVGPVTVEVSAPVHLVITAGGKVLLDTTLNVNVPPYDLPSYPMRDAVDGAVPPE